MTHSKLNTTKLILSFMTGLMLISTVSTSYALDDSEMIFDGADGKLQDCMLTDGHVITGTSTTVSCSVDGKTTECDLGKSGEVDQCATTKKLLRGALFLGKAGKFANTVALPTKTRPFTKFMVVKQMVLKR